MKTHALSFFLSVMFATANMHATPLPNGDFEKEENGRLAWWESGRFVPTRIPNSSDGSQDLGLRYVWDSVSHGAGKGSLRIESFGIHEGGKRGAASGLLCSPANEILVQPDTEYKMTWYWKGDGLTANSKAEILIFCQTPGPVAAPPAGSKFLKQFSTSMTAPNTEWQQGTLTFKTPPGTGWIDVRLSVSSDEPHKQFKIWLDDFALSRVDGGEVAEAGKTSADWKPRSSPHPASESGLDGFKLSEPPVPYGSRIQRTMHLLETSTPEHRNQVKILFYGQSIIAMNWWKNIVADLRKRYPNADIVAENPAIGGFMSDKLKDTMYGDAYPAGADLIVFHDYGASDMEEIFSKMRTLTTAEVMPMTHHVSWIGNTGMNRNHQEESDLIVSLSKKYGFEPVDIRSDWKRYLEATNVTGKEFLKDIIHLSPAGEALWLKLTMPHFKYLPDQKPYWREWVKVYTPDGQIFASDKKEYPDESKLLTKPVKLTFEGNRVDLLSSPNANAKLGTAKILIDGKAPSSFPELYSATKGSRPPDFFQPMLRRAELGKDPVIEDWTITFNKISADGADFEYDVKGSVTGPDGHGNAKTKFVSNSGRLILEPGQFMIKDFVQKIRKGVPYPDGTKCTVSVKGNFADVWKPQSPKIPGSEDRCTLAYGLGEGTHTLEIIPNGDGDLPLRAIVAHRPPKELPAVPK